MDLTKRNPLQSFALRGFLFYGIKSGQAAVLSMQLQHGSLIFLIPAAHPFQHFFTYPCCYLLNALFVKQAERKCRKQPACRIQKDPQKQMGIPIPVKNTVPEIGSCIGSQQNVFMDDIDQHGTLCNLIYRLIFKAVLSGKPKRRNGDQDQKRIKITHPP